MNEELQGRLIALEVLVAEIIKRLPHHDAERLLNAVEPGLLRQTAAIRLGSLSLIATIRRQMPLP